MANAMTFDTKMGSQPAEPTFWLTFDFALDTYATGGVLIDTLLSSDVDFLATKLKLADILTGFCNLDADAAGADRMAEFDAANRKIVLKIDAGVLAEEAAGAIGETVNGKLTVGFK